MNTYTKDGLAYFIARHLPPRIIMWCAIIVAGGNSKTSAIEAFSKYAEEKRLT